jgi:hypothetical protein
MIIFPDPIQYLGLGSDSCSPASHFGSGRAFIGGNAPCSRSKRRPVPFRFRSSGNFFLLLHANAMRATAFGIAGSADVNVQFSKSATESAPVHSQRSGGFALIPIDLSKDNKNKLLSKFIQRF